MHPIRPYQLFQVLAEPPATRIVEFSLPFRRGAGGVTVLEISVILASLRIVKASRVFEIGTFLGNTTLNLALNVPEDGRVFTLDLGEEDLDFVAQHEADAPLTRTHLAAKQLDFAGSTAEGRIEILTGNSITYDFSRWAGTIDLVFIDGGHDLATVKADTENALRIVTPDRPACILWHDYKNRDYPELTSYLDELSRERDIFHIGDTMLSVWFNDPEKKIVPQILAQQ